MASVGVAQDTPPAFQGGSLSLPDFKCAVSGLHASKGLETIEQAGAEEKSVIAVAVVP